MGKPTEMSKDPNRTINEISRYSNLASQILAEIKISNVENPRIGPVFSISDAARLVKRSTSAIRIAEAEGRLPPKERNLTGRRTGYTLQDLDHMRSVFETRPWKPNDHRACMIACQNFKGGVGKSTISVHLAQYLSQQGYRVLLVDADAQASTTMMMGYVPDQDLQENETLYGVLRLIKPVPIHSVIRKTHFHGLDFIPANLMLYNAEYEIASQMQSTKALTLLTLASELHKISYDYDVIIMDPPPALGMISLSVLCAANALLVPMPPSVVDFASTTSFFNMMDSTFDLLAQQQIVPDYEFITVAISKCGPKDNARDDVLNMTRDIFGRQVLETVIKQSAEVGHATTKMMSVYDLPAPATSYAVHQRAKKQFDALGREVEKLIRSTWGEGLVD